MNFWSASGNIYIKKRTYPEFLVFFVLLFPFFESFLTELLPLPRATRYIVDVAIVVLFLAVFLRGNFVLKSNLMPFFFLVGLFFCYVLISYVFNFQSPFYFFWGLRNNFRFYIVFFAFAVIIAEDDAKFILKFLDYLFWINAVISLFQFFVLHVRQDYLGGLFGVSGGSNGHTLVFFSIIVGKSLLATFDNEEKPLYCILKCGTSLLIAAMAEMKFYFFCFIMILFITSFITRFTLRKFVIIISALVSIAVFSLLLSSIFADGANFLNWERFIELATKEHYSSEGDLNRLFAIPTLMKNHVTEPLQQLFGLGLGNCGSSNISLFNTPFYQQYSYLHYTWFASAMMFLETGFVGLILYILFFILCLISSIKDLRQGEGNRLFCQMAIVMSILSVVLMFYNASLQIDAAYMVYFVLALPFLHKRTETKSVRAEASIEK